MRLQVPKQKLEYCWWTAVKISGQRGVEGGGTGWGQIREAAEEPPWSLVPFPAGCREPWEWLSWEWKAIMPWLKKTLSQGRWYVEERSPENGESSQESPAMLQVRDDGFPSAAPSCFENTAEIWKQVEGHKEGDAQSLQILAIPTQRAAEWLKIAWIPQMVPRTIWRKCQLDLVGVAGKSRCFRMSRAGRYGDAALSNEWSHRLPECLFLLYIFKLPLLISPLHDLRENPKSQCKIKRGENKVPKKDEFDGSKH